MKPRVLSRRAFSKASIAAPWVLRAQQAPPRARIKVDTERSQARLRGRSYLLSFRPGPACYCAPTGS